MNVSQKAGYNAANAMFMVNLSIALFNTFAN